MPAVRIDLTEPPRVAALGLGLHGVGRLTDTFRLPELWSLHLYSYTAELEVDRETLPVAPGSVSLVPPGALIRYRYQGPSRHLYAHLRAPSGSRASAMPMMMSPGPDLPVITDLMRSAVTSAATRPERTRADIWTVLLRLSEGSAAVPPGRAAAVSAAAGYVSATMSCIESRLADALTVAEIAEVVGISANHLTRVFTAQTGETVVGYLRRRRVEHARRLLVGSTMSISAIAATVGIPDLQAFNKTCRAVTGRSPRQLRAGEL